MAANKTRHWRVFNIKLDLDADQTTALPRALADRLRTSPRSIRDLQIVKRSFDARKHRPRFTYVIDAEVDRRVRVTPRQGQIEHRPTAKPLPVRHPRVDARVAVVGAGPCGLFAALTLARAGLKPIIIDRGRPVERRGKDVGALINRATLNPESNLCFGEGGAGTWSDGKLTTRISAPQVRHVLETLHDMGAPARILTDGKPHLGTDKLVKILKQFRKILTECGAEYRWDTRVDDIIIEDGRLRAITLADGERVDVDHAVFAIGHSARDVYERLIERGVQLETKPFAVGFRVEHAQALINDIQYGDFANHPHVPTADYRLATQVGKGERKRGVYSFCMCPGGQIMPTATQPDEVVINGMSNASRSGRWANSALVVTVNPEDIAPFGEGILAGADLQRAAERAAGALGGGDFKAPAQNVPDFIAGRPSQTLRKTSYRPGITPTRLDSLYPTPIIEALKHALRDFEKAMPGFIYDEAILHGVETRTSAPVRVVRDRDTLMSVSVEGLFPAGEGAGYAGGIVSAAVDGVRVADQILIQLES